MPRERPTEEELKAWVPDEALELLNMERVLEPELTHEETARRILMSAAPMAAQSVAHLSVHGRDERIRFTAAKYIIDGVVGGGFKGSGDVDDMLMALVIKLQDNDAAAEQMRQKLT
jgi:diadenosine tetraphosphate (Ap4A) HIT family hydrolase